ncbi:unnamed protein product [Penicillium olsonii]|nr:unnamed protein product [Penicillium olsonii]CAG7917156.1 unnamed protein product [Penicillium olsonii]
MGKNGWDHPLTKRTTYKQSMEFVEYWADVYMDTRDEIETIGDKINALRAEVEEAQILNEKGIYTGLGFTVALQEANRLEVRRSRLSSFHHFFRDPEEQLKGARNPLGKMLANVDLKLEDIPVRDGHYASMRFLREVMRAVKQLEPKYETQWGRPYDLLGAYDELSDAEDEENKQHRQAQAVKKTQATNSRRVKPGKSNENVRSSKSDSQIETTFANDQVPSEWRNDFFLPTSETEKNPQDWESHHDMTNSLTPEDPDNQTDLTPRKANAACNHRAELNIQERELSFDEWCSGMSSSLTPEEWDLANGVTQRKPCELCNQDSNNSSSSSSQSASQTNLNHPVSAINISSPATDSDQLPNLGTPVTTQETAAEGASCVSCMEELLGDAMVVSDCKHAYCRKCALHMMEESMKGEMLFPPRCCGGFLQYQPKKHLFDAGIWLAFETEMAKFNDPSPLYCSDPRCSAYIPPSLHGGCQKCTRKTCMECRKEAHEGTCDFRGTEEDRQLENLAREKKWRRCFGCGHMVELNWGCNHMTCVCGHQFCYLCGKEWKTCICPQYSEDDEDAVADERRARRDPNHPLFDFRRVCQHQEGWTRLVNDTPCAGCNRRNTYAVLRCNACQLQLCGPCRQHNMEARRDGYEVDEF